MKEISAIDKQAQARNKQLMALLHFLEVRISTENCILHTCMHTQSAA